MKLNIYYVGHNSMYNNFYKTCDLRECYNYLKDKEVISIDIETSYKFEGKYNKEFHSKYGEKVKNPNSEGLDPYLSNIIMFQIGDEHKQFIIDYREIDIEILRPILESKDIVKVGQNIKFEYLHIFHNNNIRLNNVYDTMIVEQILFNGLNKPVSLKALNERYLNITVDKTTRLEFSVIRDKPFTLKQINYGAEDILYPLLIRKQQLHGIEQKGVKNCVDLEMSFLLVLGDIEYKGMHFDTNIWKNTFNINLIEYNRLENELNNFVINNYKNTNFIVRQLDLFNTDIKCNIQWTSSKQVIEFFNYLDICPQEVSKTTKKLSYTVNGAVLLASLKTINKDKSEKLKEIINIYLDFKKAEQSCTTFGIEFSSCKKGNKGAWHLCYRQILNTGRISSSNPNLQNIPALHGFRSAFNCKKGWKIVNADYSGQEQIILANKSNDKDLISFYELGRSDMHSFIASKIYNNPYDDYVEAVRIKKAKEILSDYQKKLLEERQIAKAAGFAINYGGNGYTISKNLGISPQQGDFVYDAYFKAFPGLKNYFRKVQKETFQRGYILIDPITGRKNWYKPYFDKKSKSKIERNALNYPIQGEAGGITKYAPVLFRQWILNNNLQESVFITNLVHDKILLWLNLTNCWKLLKTIKLKNIKKYLEMSIIYRIFVHININLKMYENRQSAAM